MYKVYTFGVRGSEQIDSFETLKETIDFAKSHWIGFDKVTDDNGEVVYNAIYRNDFDETYLELKL